MNKHRLMKRIFLVFTSQLLGLICATLIFANPVDIVDANGRHQSLMKRPSRVVSLVPSITEIIVKTGAADVLKGITYHSSNLPGALGIQIVGGFYSPDTARIEAIKPDIIFCSSLQQEVFEKFSNNNIPLINLETRTLADSYDNVLLIGKIFNADKEAEKIVNEIKKEIQFISKKVDKIPKAERVKVMRIMGFDNDNLMTPGDDSFQNEMIKAAGGIAPRFNKNGQVISITRNEWVAFNPEVVYVCGGYGEKLEEILNQPGWRDVEAAKNHRILDFPCDLTCRASTNTADFISWLSGRIYYKEFKDSNKQVSEDRITHTKKLDISLPYLKEARICYSSIRDFPNKTLLVDFKHPMTVLSTLEGFRNNISSVANHYSSPPCWSINHDLALPELNKLVLNTLDRQSTGTSMLFTGADIDNLSVQKASCRDMDVYALVTAGVTSNAVRMSRDMGQFYEPGTINIILMTNMRLTPRAMSKAIISITEAKTAAMQDLDIRSTYTPAINQATGTGTDNMIIVEGEGLDIDTSGGHSKMGELIAKAVYDGVKEAVYKQNGIVTHRNIFQRLAERKIDIPGLISFINCDCGVPKSQVTRDFERVLLYPEYSSFMSSSIALSDDYEKGLIKDLTPYRLWCKAIAEDIAVAPIETLAEIIDSDEIPLVIRMSLNAIINGLIQRAKGENAL